jgi:tRNA U34 2-thiouridine synthase MnmA/TrmU
MTSVILVPCAIPASSTALSESWPEWHQVKRSLRSFTGPAREDARPPELALNSWLCATWRASEVQFDEPQMSVTPGQTAVFYDGDSVVGSGLIQ